MIKGLPRPFLWTEKKTMKEFLKEEKVADLLYNNFLWLQKYHSLPVVDELMFFNELYYQLTRYYYEKPQSEDYPRYEADIKKKVGQECYVDLLMTMMYHYCRLRRSSDEQLLTDGFLQAIVKIQSKKKYWSHFLNITSPGSYWVKTAPYPQNPCPVPPKELRTQFLNWFNIIHGYDLDAVKDVLNLWKEYDDKKAVAEMIDGSMQAGLSCYPQQAYERQKVKHYLMTIINNDYEKSEPEVAQTGPVLDNQEAKNYLSGRIKNGVLEEDENMSEDDPILGKCFKFNYPFVHNLVKEVVHEYYGDIAANLALIEIVMYEHNLLRKSNAHALFAKALVVLGLLQPENEEGIVKSIRDKYKRLPGTHYKEWSNDFIKAKRACVKIGEKVDEIRERWQIKTS